MAIPTTGKMVLISKLAARNGESKTEWKSRDGYGLGQWETALQCHIISDWLSSYPEWSLEQKTNTTANFDQELLEIAFSLNLNTF